MRLLHDRPDADGRGAAAQQPQPSEAEIVAAMDPVLCRCGAYVRIKRAVARAAEIAAQEGGL